MHYTFIIILKDTLIMYYKYGVLRKCYPQYLCYPIPPPPPPPLDLTNFQSLATAMVTTHNTTVLKSILKYTDGMIEQDTEVMCFIWPWHIIARAPRCQLI